ncbi:MAG: 7TM diverse intracellular signaling domain-containing protein [Flavobacteriales bacterium]
MIRKTYKIIALIIFLFQAGDAFSQKVIVLDEKISDDYLIEGKATEILEDKSNKLEITDVAAPSHLGQFTPYNEAERFAYIKNPESTYWIKFQLKAAHPLSKHYILENSDSHIDNFELYKQAENDSLIYVKEKAGFTSDFGIRPYSHKNFVFDINVGTTAQTYFVRVKSGNKNPFIFKIRSTSSFARYALAEYYLLGLFYGILVIMGLYNLIMFFSLKDRVYLHYVLYVICCAMVSLAEDGLGFQYLWPGAPELNPVISQVAPLLLLLTFTFYAKSFLELKTLLPKINKALNIIMLFYIAFFFVGIVIGMRLHFEFYLLPFLFIYIASILCIRKGLHQARYFIIGYSFMIVTIIFLAFRMSGLIHSDNILFVYSFNIGFVFEIVILSLALGDRIKLIRAKQQAAQQRVIEQLKENELLKDKVNRELEEKVQERTRDLDAKNIELKDAYEEINRMNALLNEDNKQLKTNVKELTKARVLMKEVNFEEFSRIFPDKDSCLKYLVDLKWSKGYACKKCGNPKWCEGKDEYYRRCTKCRYDESPTVDTIFHKLKFPINKAFYLLFLVFANKEKITSLELSNILSLRQSTCWTFNKKIHEVMAKRKKSKDKEQDGWSQLVLNPEEEK